MPNLPEDLVEEILCRIPATYLKRLRPTCKLWNRLYKSSSFARKHSASAAKQFLALMFTKNLTILSLRVSLHGTPSLEINCAVSQGHPYSNPDDINHVFHCDGLLLCTLGDESTILIWNPFTGETRWIETGKNVREGWDFVLGYYQDNKSCSKSYKILRFYHSSNMSSEIYEFSSDSWRVLDDSELVWSVVCNDHGVSLKGNTYWFGTETRLGISLLKFDFSADKYECVPLPSQCHDYDTACISVVGEEKLSVLLKRENETMTEVWVTNMIDETKVVSWNKVLAFDLSPNIHISSLGSFLLDEEKKIVMCCEREMHMDLEDEYEERDMVYTVGENNLVTQVDFGVATSGSCWPAIVTYIPSLVQIQ